MSENLQRQRDDGEKDGLTLATGAWPYVRIDPAVKREARALMLIDDMPTLVTMKEIGNGAGLLQYHGFYKDQWYTDFIAVDNVQDADEVEKATQSLLELAEEMLENDLHEPEAAPEATETP